MNSTPTRPAFIERYWLLPLLLIAAAVILLYTPGTGGDLHFDDPPNLQGLAEIDSSRDALVFVLSGEAGPLGRPLALASFVPQADAWPNQVHRLLWTNVIIHAVNTLLVGWLAWLLACAAGQTRRPAAWIGLLTSATWASLPILASSSLLLVQRMTTLSALFVLLGLIGFLLGHRLLFHRPQLGLLLTGASLVLFTPLAALTKENGALLPLFALVAVLTLLPQPPASVRRPWRLSSLVLFWLPLLLLLAVIISRVPYPESTAFFRDFSAGERLLTQARILWEYLFKAFVPIQSAWFGPFHDHYPVSRSLWEPLTLLATTAWLGLIALAVFNRRRWPVFAFGLGWYLVGHGLESSLLSLDLYFEHRNYLPLFGPAFALAWLVTGVPARYRRLAATGMTAYVALLALTLWVVTSQWGRPFIAVEQQYVNNQNSSRALGHYVSNLVALGLVAPSLELLENAAVRGVNPVRLRLTQLYFRCRYDQPDLVAADTLVQRLREQLPTAGPDRRLAGALRGITTAAADYDCPQVDTSQAASLVDALAAHPRYNYRNSYWNHLARADLARAKGDDDQHRHHLSLALARRFDPALLAKLIEPALSGQEHFAEACELLSAQEQTLPRDPRKRLARNLVIRDVQERLQQARGSTCPDISNAADQAPSAP